MQPMNSPRYSLRALLLLLALSITACDGGMATEGDTVSVDGFAEAVPLINSVVTTERDVALVRVLNFTPDSVSLTSLGDQDLLFCALSQEVAIHSCRLSMKQYESLSTVT